VEEVGIEKDESGTNFFEGENSKGKTQKSNINPFCFGFLYFSAETLMEQSPCFLFNANYAVAKK
jgi:hypothetical protein